MNSEEKKWVRGLIVWVVLSATLAFGFGHWMGYNSGQTETINALAAHYLGDPNETEKWRQAAMSWEYAAEHYGGICKWLLLDKPIYGTIEMGDNATLSDCLIVSGSSEASINVNGENGYIVNNHFMALDMDWVVSTTAIDPNEFEIDPNTLYTKIAGDQ